MCLLFPAATSFRNFCRRNRRRAASNAVESVGSPSDRKATPSMTDFASSSSLNREPEQPHPAAADEAEEREGLAEILAGSQRGEVEARRELFERYQRLVYRLVFRIVGEVEAADLTQDVFLRVFEKIHQFQGWARFETWLYRLAVNECLQHLRREKTRRLHLSRQQPLRQTAGPSHHLEQTELLTAALNQLEPELKTVFVLREREQRNYREIAEAMNVAEGTVASRLNRARRRLREILIELGWEP